MRQALYGTGMAIVLVSLATPLLASVAPVPEFDGGSIITGLGLVTGGILMLRARMGRK